MTAHEEAERRWPRGFTGRPFAIEHFVQGATWALEEAERALAASAPPVNSELNYDGSEDKEAAAYVQGYRDAWAALTALRKEQS